MWVPLSCEPANNGEGVLHTGVPVEVIGAEIAQDIEDDAVGGVGLDKSADAFLILLDIEVEKRVIALLEGVDHETIMDKLFFLPSERGAHSSKISFEPSAGVFALK